MNPPPNREVTLFSAAIELDASQRAAFLDAACADDPALRLRLDALLKVHQKAITFLELEASAADAQQPHGTQVPPAIERSVSSPAEKPGDRIGRYKLLQQIGEGGCGVVYMAEQEEPVRRRVALKVIKLGMDTKQVIARFEAERQALAMMDHPNIAKVLDGGATNTGRPFFVMELVRGIKITDYCDQNNLPTHERLNLFTQVCQAIQHAHQKGIIHRDIKPSNIIVTVTEPGAPGCPKVIDFGIAKATTGQRLTDRTVFTAFEQFVGTPAYMSPEQAMLTSLDIDTRTDIYALGVLLYELLTGRTPFATKDLLEAGLDAMRRTICEKEPLRPSTRLSTMLEGELTTAAKHRHTDPPRLIHLLRGDLDWIVMKAIEKDRARRYETANGLSRDVERYLADEPISARPPSKLYRFKKLARRNKLVFAAAAAVSAALFIGMAASSWEYLKERKSREQAVAVSGLLEKLLSSADPDGLKGSDYTVRQLLDDFTAGLTNQNQLAGQPEVEATVRLAIGWTYSRLGGLSQAETNLRRAFDLRLRALGPAHADTLEAQYCLAKLVVDEKRDWKEGTGLSFENWQGRLRLLGPMNRATLSSQETYAAALSEGGRAQEAIPIEREVLQIRKRVLGPDHPDTIDSLGTLAQALGFMGSYAEAERYVRDCLVAQKHIGASDTQDGIICSKELALLRLERGDPAEAVKVLEELLPRATKFLSADHLMTLLIRRLLARALAEDGQLGKAETICRETLDLSLHAKAREPYGTARTQLTLGRVLVQEGQLEEAEIRLNEALTFFRDDVVSQKRPELSAQAANWLGAIRLLHHDYSNAETLMLSGADQFTAHAVEMSPNERRLALDNMINLYQAWGKPQQQAIWQRKLDTLILTFENR